MRDVISLHKTKKKKTGRLHFRLLPLGRRKASCLLHLLYFRRRARIARGSEDRLFFVARPPSATAPLLLGGSALLLLLLPRGHFVLFVRRLCAENNDGSSSS